MKKKISVFDLRTATIVHTGTMERARESLLRALLIDREWSYARSIQLAHARSRNLADGLAREIERARAAR